MLPSHQRYAYSGITERAPYAWPGSKKLAVYVALNLEHYAFGEGLTEELVTGMPKHDILNHSWREYGNRVGAWRCLELFDALALPAAALVNTALYDHCPELVQACVARRPGCRIRARRGSARRAAPRPARCTRRGRRRTRSARG